jgi:nucleotide-binding universal stress UspA family protein
MYVRIMVPLDGSKLAECALAHLEEIAKGCHPEEVVLVSVTERVKAYRALDDFSKPMGQRLASEAVGKKERQAQRYLDRIAKGLESQGIKVRTEVLLGNPAQEITFYAEHKSVDLIVMASHGRSGPSKWAHGSVADKVFRASCVPILMVRAPGCVPGI